MREVEQQSQNKSRLTSVVGCRTLGVVKDRRIRLLEQLSKTFPSGEGHRVAIAIAGAPIDLVTRSAELAAQARTYFADYLRDNAGVSPRIRMEPLDAPLWEDVDPEFFVEGDTVVQRDFAAKRLGDDAIAYVAPGLDDALHNLLRWFSPVQLLRRGAFLLHGAGAIKDGTGYVFFGQSGAGKSTTMRLIAEADPDALVLGDDAIIVQMRDGQPWVHSAPLGCGYSRKAPPCAAAPLAGLFALHQDTRDAVERLPNTQGAAALVASAMNVRFEDQMEERLILAFEFAAAPPGIRRLRFTKTPSFWNNEIYAQ